MARDAAARLYDVDARTFAFKKFNKSKKYDVGTISFRAKPGKLVQLDKLHESMWATRLSGRTRSGLVKIEVTAVGKATVTDGKTVFLVSGSEDVFTLDEDSELEKKEDRAIFGKLQEAMAKGRVVTSVTGRLDGWSGRWPTVLRRIPTKPRRILVSEFTTESQ